MRIKTFSAIIMAIVILLIPFRVTQARIHEQNTDVPFPEYSVIKPNVAFWKKIYAEYSTSQGIIHDKQYVDIIYEVVPLKSYQGAGNERANRKKIKAVKKKYKTVLKKLAKGKKPTSKLEKRVFALFKSQKDTSVLKSAWKNIRFQLGQKDRFRKGLIRSGAYLKEIRQIVKSYGLPVDLAYLPHVESSFNYKAYSKFGAAGIWQFTRGTGKKYMKINYTLDERRDPILATYAAVKYLKENYEKLGDWPLAITAYNHGVNGMMRAQKKTGNLYVSIFNQYNGRSFGFASRNFYSEFLAAREVAKNYQKYFGNLNFHSPVERIEIPLAGYISVKDVEDHFQVAIKRIRDLNPALRKPVFQGQKYIPKGYKLYLPKINREFKKVAVLIPQKLFKSKQKPSLFYRVQRGDTAGKIARAEGIRLRDLILANQLNSRATIYVGQHLRIPTSEEKILLAAVSNPKQLIEKQKKTTLAPSIKEQPDSKGKKPILKEIQTLSQQAGISEESPKPMPSSTLSGDEDGSSPGSESTQPVFASQQKKMPDSKASSLAPPTTIAELVNPAVLTGHLEVEKIFTKGKMSYGIIRVEPEETLGHYADWLEIPTQKLRNINGLKFGKSIHTNQTLEIPFKKIEKVQFEERRYEYHKSIEEDFFSVYMVENIRTYKVKRGDNIWTLCLNNFELPLWLIKKYNPGQNLNDLRPAKKLRVPVVKKMEEQEEAG